MEFTIDNIWLSAENRWDETLSPKTGSTDVVVEFNNGKRWVASFFTYNHIEQKRIQHKATSEYLHGQYFWVKGMVIIENCTRSSIEEIVRHLIEEGDFQDIFTLISK